MRRAPLVALAGLAVLVPLAMLVGVAFGGAAVAPGALVHALLHPTPAATSATIVWQLRVPRVAIAATVGASLALAGALLQALLRNPLIDPYLTGVVERSGRGDRNRGDDRARARAHPAARLRFGLGDGGAWSRCSRAAARASTRSD